MVKIKLAVLRSTRAKDGTYKIRIAIGHKSETHYIVTRFSVPSLSNFRNGTIIGTPTAHHDNLKLRQLLTDYEERLERIPNLSELTPVQLRDTLQRLPSTTHTTTIAEAFDAAISVMESENRQTKVIRYARKTFLRFFPSDTPLTHITPTTIEAFRQRMSSSHLSNNTINNNMNQLRKVINIAIRDGLVRYDTHPFAYWRTLSTPFRDIDISASEMRLIANYQTDNPQLSAARDALILSFLLGGINLVDLLKIDFNHTNGQLDYIRTKTSRTSGTRVQFSIHPKAQEIINRLIQPNGHLIFHTLRTPSSIARNVNIYTRKLAALLHIRNAEHLSYYTARKTFVQIAFDLGISLEVIEYCVGHSTNHHRTIYNYLRVMSRHADDAISKIADFIFSPDVSTETPPRN